MARLRARLRMSSPARENNGGYTSSVGLNRKPFFYFKKKLNTHMHNLSGRIMSHPEVRVEPQA